MNMPTKFHTKPQVRLVGRMAINHEELEGFANDENIVWKSDSGDDCSVLVENAGRICYMSYENPRPGGNTAYVDNIKQQGHGSVLEHAVYQFVVTGVSRTLTHELVRHRAGFAYSQLSQRYVDESGTGFVCPEIIWNDEISRGIWIESVLRSRDDYSKLTDRLTQLIEEKSHDRTNKSLKREARKAARQAGRSVLPGCTETKIWITVNARALIHLFGLRGSQFADPEIRKLAYEMFKKVEYGVDGLPCPFFTGIEWTEYTEFGYTAMFSTVRNPKI